MKKVSLFMFIACAAIMMSCAGNANKNAAQEVVEEAVVVAVDECCADKTGCTCVDKTACAEKKCADCVACACDCTDKAACADKKCVDGEACPCKKEACAEACKEKH